MAHIPSCSHLLIHIYSLFFYFFYQVLKEITLPTHGRLQLTVQLFIFIYYGSILSCTLWCNQNHCGQWNWHPQRDSCTTLAGLWWHTWRRKKPVALILTHTGPVTAVTSPKSPMQTVTGTAPAWLLRQTDFTPYFTCIFLPVHSQSTVQCVKIPGVYPD